jgi:biopolymer transport protein TolR
MSQINVVPYIDGMLVLLVIFMITAPLMNPGQIELPTIGKAPAPAPVQPLELVLDKSANLVLRDRNRKGFELKDVSRDEIAAYIREHQAGAASQAVVISADKNVRYEEVINVMNMLQQMQVKKVGLLVQSQQ